MAGLLGAVPRQVVFTSGATEAINAAVWGACHARRRARPCSARPSSTRPSATPRPALAPVETLGVDGTGRLDLDALARPTPGDRAPRPALVHCQWANHEVGTLQPVHEVVALCRDAGVTVHVDAAAACGHVPTDLGALDADLVSVSAHKLGGVPGAGRARRAARQPLRTAPRRRRAGAGAAGRARADPCGCWPSGPPRQRWPGDDGRATRRRGGHGPAPDRRRGASRAWPSTASRSWARPIATDRLPHLVCLGVHGVEAEPVLIGLDRAGVAVHSGSACSSESIEPSPVLEAMGADPSHSLRVSVGWTTTDEERAAFADAFARVVVGPARPTGLTSSWSTWTTRAPARPARACRQRRRTGRPRGPRPPKLARRRAVRQELVELHDGRRRCCGPGWPGSGLDRGGPGSSWATR